MKVRDAKRDDLDFLLHGVRDNRALEGRTPRSPEAEASLAEGFADEIERGRVRIVERDGEAVAFLCFKLDFRVMYVDEPFLWIDLVYVRGDHRGEGLGKLLYDDATVIAKELGVKSVVADVFAANEGSIAFHRRVGFEPLYTIFRKEV